MLGLIIGTDSHGLVETNAMALLGIFWKKKEIFVYLILSQHFFSFKDTSESLLSAKYQQLRRFDESY